MKFEHGQSVKGSKLIKNERFHLAKKILYGHEYLYKATIGTSKWPG